MATLWKDRLFSFFGGYDKRSDTLKDINGFGIWERFNRAIGQSIDYELQGKVDDLIANIYDPETCLDRYVVYLESMMGYNQARNTLYVSPLLSKRRNVLKKILRFYQIKGTKKAYTLMLSMIGISTTITENFNDYGFDSPVTLDDTLRRFDMRCDTCSTYDLVMTGPAITTAIYNAIWSVVMFNEPINAKINVITYNGNVLTPPGGYDFDNSFDNSFN